MKYRLSDVLVCTSCQRGLALTGFEEKQPDTLSDRFDKRCSTCFYPESGNALRTCQDCCRTKINEDLLTCSCGNVFPIVNSIPVMLPHTQDSFKLLRQKYPLNAAAPDSAHNAQGRPNRYQKNQQHI